MTYQQDYSCIIGSINNKGGLFIGNLEAAQNPQTLKKHGINAILTAARGVKLQHSKQLIPYYLYIPADDHQQFDLSKYFNQAANFIKDALLKTNVMVHCLAGVSRSVSLVIAYFIKYLGKNYEQSYKIIKSKRKVIQPNPSFCSQLKKYQQKLKTLIISPYLKEISQDRAIQAISCSLPTCQIKSQNKIIPLKEVKIMKNIINQNMKIERIPGKIRKVSKASLVNVQAPLTETKIPLKMIKQQDNLLSYKGQFKREEYKKQQSYFQNRYRSYKFQKYQNLNIHLKS